MGNPANDVWIGALTGQTYGDYRLDTHLGGGWFTLVFEATHLPTGKKAALKILPPTATGTDSAAEFQNEGQLLTATRGCSNVVELDRSDRLTHLIPGLGGTTFPVEMPYHVLELAQGRLEELVLNRADLDWADRLGLWRGVVLGTHQLHLRKVVHRDLKSENCLLFLRPKNLMDCKASDLGRSRHLGAPAMHDPLLYMTGLGDGRFAPPEFLTLQGKDTREAHLAADLYGLGSVLFELVTGQGLTSMAVGSGPHIRDANLDLWRRGQAIDLSGLRGAYDQAFQVFEEALPAALRIQASDLLRQLCDPEPLKRFPKPKFGKGVPDQGLEWVLRRADILIRIVTSGRATSLQKGA